MTCVWWVLGAFVLGMVATLAILLLTPDRWWTGFDSGD